ncbi:hypothetical protein SLEP1_g23760 [Rubroshorea leprosula]|uniref:Zinc finger GRF-type domain-containing protein n=1 Tax=Rubroshorea leprosula TaxID=152421 RepID=A0AAV5JDC6_9ROSI|nr:hypothetical protein SLEP1_g23760 [Rubroshorea leprosula]
MSRTYGNSFSRGSASCGASTSSSRPRFILYDGIPEYDYPPPIRHCDCGKFAPQWTTWRDSNPSCRFYGCPDLRKCDYFVWHDTDFTQRAKNVIWYFYNEKKKLLRENFKLRKQLKHSNEEDVEQTRQRQSVSVNEGIEETTTNQPVEEVGCDQLSKINKVEKRMHEMENLLEKKMQTTFCKLGCVIVALCFLNLAFINFLFW